MHSDVGYVDRISGSIRTESPSSTMSTSPARQPISVTYSSTPNLQSYLTFILKSLHAQFPLRNLHWKTPSRPAIRTIQECNLRLVSLIEAQSRGDVREWIAPDEVEYGNLLSQCPLIHLCFIECEVSSVGATVTNDKLIRLPSA